MNAPLTPLPVETAFRLLPTVTLGGLPIAVVDRRTEAALMIRAAREWPRGNRPLYLTSANGEVVATAARDPEIARLFLQSDQIVADGQPMVFASRFLCPVPLPERVATTDLFHDVAELAQAGGQSFYLLGATEEENARALGVIRARYPRLRIAGASHGYLAGEALEDKLREIDTLAPDILWLGLGVPREQIFVRDHAHKLPHVGIIKTSGGLFNHISGKNRRAPRTMQALGLEWMWRIFLEPRRLFWRYLTTNPRAAFLLLTRSG